MALAVGSSLCRRIGPVRATKLAGNGRCGRVAKQQADGDAGRTTGELERESLAIVLAGTRKQRTPWDVLDDAEKLDPYKILGVPFLSGRSAVRKAYVRLAREEHPDLHAGHTSMEWLMGEWAYRQLMDAQAKTKYDTARVLRNALSLTEGVVAFTFAAAVNLGTFLADAWETFGQASQKDFGPSAPGPGANVRLPSPADSSAKKESEPAPESKKESKKAEVEVTKPEVEVTKPEAEVTKLEVDATKPKVEVTKPEVEETKPGVEAKKPEGAVAQPVDAGSGQDKKAKPKDKQGRTVMTGIVELRDDIASLREEIQILSEDASRTRERIAQLREQPVQRDAK